MSNDNNCFSCIDCRLKSCNTDEGLYPEFCPTAALMEGALEGASFDEAIDLYLDDEEVSELVYNLIEYALLREETRKAHRSKG